MSVDFSQLPQPDFIEVLDFEVILAARKAYLISLFPADQQEQVRQAVNRESEPLNKFLQENAYRELILRSETNKKALGTLLAFATGNDLDAVAANYDVKRLTITDDAESIIESDDDLRYRTQKALDALSTAGPESSYEFHALSSDARVADVKCSSPTPAHALLTILQRDTATGAATEEVKQIVSAYVCAEKRRPTGDRVQIQSAEIVPYEVEAVLYFDNVPETDSLLSQSIENITAYTKTPKRIGRGIYFSDLYSALKVTGVERVELIKPNAEIKVKNLQAASCTSIKVTVAT